jgi:hypothetical protein
MTVVPAGLTLPPLVGPLAGWWAGRAVFSAAGAVAVGGLLVVLDGGGQGQQQRPCRDLVGEGRVGCAFRVAVLVDGQVGVTADDGQAEDPGVRSARGAGCGPPARAARPRPLRPARHADPAD